MTRPAELVLRSDTLEVVVLPELGGRIHRLRAFGTDLLRTPADPAQHADDPFSWGAFVMAPWCNRIDPRSEGSGGLMVALEPNFPDGSAIHGQVYARPWGRWADEFVVRGGGDGWPWPYEVGLRVRVTGQTVRVELRLTNRSEAIMPAGLGIHPWFVRPVLVAIRAGAVYTANVGSTPLPEPLDGAHDLRQLRPMPTGLDATWTEIGDIAVELEWPTTGIRALMRVTSPSTHIVAASPADIDAVAVEPQTHAPQGLRRQRNGEPGALALLAPDQTLKLGVEMLCLRARRRSESATRAGKP